MEHLFFLTGLPGLGNHQHCRVQPLHQARQVVQAWPHQLQGTREDGEALPMPE